MGPVPTLLTFDFLGDREIMRRLERIDDSINDASPAFNVMGDSLARAERRQFASQGAYGSGGWAPLSPAYARWKAKHYPGAKILHRTGDLEDSLTRRPFGIDVVEHDQAIFGTTLGYAIEHQHGNNRMPARPPIDLPESVRRRWVKILQRYLLTGVAKEE